MTNDNPERKDRDNFKKLGKRDGAEIRSGSSSGLTDVVAAYAELSKIVLNEQPLGVVLRRIAELAAEIVPGADDVSVTLIERDRARSVAFTGALAVALDERQYELGFGPCMAAAATGQLVQIENTAADGTYPEFSRLAHRRGIRQILSVGMPTQQSTTGALNVYGAGTGGPFDQVARDITTAFAGYAAIALLNAALYAGAIDEVAQMHQALASRAGIEQAKGILMRDRRCTADEAFNILREMSARSNRKLRDVARTIIDDVIG
jgi:GAF domain-containing protein